MLNNLVGHLMMLNVHGAIFERTQRLSHYFIQNRCQTGLQEPRLQFRRHGRRWLRCATLAKGRSIRGKFSDMSSGI